MKKTLQIFALALFLAAVSGITSCSKSSSASYSLPTMQACVLASSNQHYQYFSYTVSDSGLLAALSTVGVTQVSRVNSITLSQIRLSVVTAGVTLNDIASLQVYFKTVNNPNDSVQIAYSDSIPNGATQAYLKLDGAQLTQFLSNNAVFTVDILNPPSGNTPYYCVQLDSAVLKMQASD